jgi:hypothetical protein
MVGLNWECSWCTASNGKSLWFGFYVVSLCYNPPNGSTKINTNEHTISTPKGHNHSTNTPLQVYIKGLNHNGLEHPQSSCTISLKAERGGKTWIAVQASRRKACIQVPFTGWNLVLEGFLGGLVTGFGIFCLGKTLTFGRTTFSWLRGYRLTRRLGMLLVYKLNYPTIG